MDVTFWEKLHVDGSTGQYVTMVTSWRKELLHPLPKKVRKKKLMGKFFLIFFYKILAWFWISKNVKKKKSKFSS